MNKEFDITAFGAAGDGITDCTRAIQNAVNAAAECMGTVIIPPGVYMTGKLTVRGQGISLVGTSAWSFRSDGASILRLNTDVVDCMMDISGAYGLTLRGICMDGQQLGKDIHGIKLYWPKYNGGNQEDTPTIDDCRIGNFSGNGLHFDHIWCFSLRHSMIHRNQGAGMYITGWDGFIIDNWFSGNRGGSIVSGEIVNSITCTGNRVEWNQRGGFILKWGDSYNITGNFFDRSFGPALEIGGPDTHVDLVTITGNIFRRSGALPDGETFEIPDYSSHVILNNCSGTVVTGNTMRCGQNDDGAGLISPNYSFIITDCEECIIKDNTMCGGALVENIVLRGDNSTSVIDCNIGRTGVGYLSPEHSLQI